MMPKLLCKYQGILPTNSAVLTKRNLFTILNAMTTPERQLEERLIETLQGLKLDTVTTSEIAMRSRRTFARGLRYSTVSSSPTANSSVFSTRSLPPTSSPPRPYSARSTASFATTAPRSTTLSSTSRTGAKTPSRLSTSSASTPTTASNATT